MSIDELKLKLVQARVENEKAKEYAAEQWKGVEDTTAHRLYQDAVDAAKISAEALDAADKELREAALLEWKGFDVMSAAINGAPYDEIVAGKVSPGVTIKFHHNLRYKIEDVIEWCWEKHKGFILLDKKAFEGSAKKGTLHGAPFEKYDEPYVVLSTKNEDFQLPV